MSNGPISPAQIEVTVQEIIGFLADSCSYNHHPQTVHIIQTHASIVAIAPPFVYKVKKNVNHGFLDYSTLDKRKHFCEQEVILNRRLAPDIYLGITPIVRNDNKLAFSETGNIVEYAVTMRCVPDDALLKHRLAKGQIGRSDMVALGKLLGQFYRSQKPEPAVAEYGAPEAIRYSIEENFTQTERFVNTALSPAAFRAIKEFNNMFFQRFSGVLERRAAEGRIKECHGDLHLEHIAFLPNGIRILDCIEFNSRFRCIDTASDVAFLAMDLEFHKRFDLAQTLVETVAAETGDKDIAPILNFYKCYRAYVRGKIAALRAMSAALPDTEKYPSLVLAKKYFRLALHYALSQSRPTAIFVMGKPASGKSSLAQHIAAETGWKYCSSDITRKELAGIHLFERKSDAERRALYSASMTEKTYSTLEKEMLTCGAARRQIVIDATFGSRHQRERFRMAATKAGMRYCFIVARADEAETIERLARREHNTHTISDARLEDYQLITAKFEEPDELPPTHVIQAESSRSQRQIFADILVQMAQQCFDL